MTPGDAKTALPDRSRRALRCDAEVVNPKLTGGFKIILPFVLLLADPLIRKTCFVSSGKDLSKISVCTHHP